MPPALTVANVHVRYGETVALSDVSISFDAGLIHAIVGQNGAGKTTFARMCAGIVTPVSGHLSVFGRPVSAGSVRASRCSGVELVHQSFALPPSFTIAEALEYGSTRRRGTVFTKRQLEARWRPHLESLAVRAPLGAVIRDLPVETQQAVEIARALAGDARVIILDEPTAVLSPKGIEVLFSRLRRLKTAGVTVLIILHKVREVLAIAETVTVLRSGNVVASMLPAPSLDLERLSAIIIGSSTDSGVPIGKAKAISVQSEREGWPLVLRLTRAKTRAADAGPNLDHVTLSVRQGEIVGVAGVEGNGQRQLVSAIAGLSALVSGEVHFGDHDVTREPLQKRRARGLRIIPFERNIEGLSLSSRLWENWAALSLITRPLLEKVDPTRLRSRSSASFFHWGVRFESVEQVAASLSGGNAQRVILAREVDEGASLIVAAQPTRGLDIEAIAFVWRALRVAQERGCGVLVISSDLDELFEVSDRIVVMLSGKVVGEFAPPFDVSKIGPAMTGASV